MTTATKNTKADPKPISAAALKKANAAAAKLAASTGDEIAEQAAVDLNLDQPAPPSVIEAVKAAATASAQRRELNAADKITAKAKRAEDVAARRATIDAFHDEVVSLFKGGMSIDEIGVKFTNERTGKPYSSGTIRWILVKKGVVVQSKRPAKFDVESLTAEQFAQVAAAIGAIKSIASEHDVSFLAVTKAVMVKELVGE